MDPVVALRRRRDQGSKLRRDKFRRLTASFEASVLARLRASPVLGLFLSALTASAASAAVLLRAPRLPQLGRSPWRYLPCCGGLRRSSDFLDSRIAIGVGVFIFAFDEQPVLALGVTRPVPAQAHKMPAALKSLTMKVEGQVAALEIALGVAEWFPRAVVPEHDGAATILALRDGTFERSVIERMVFDSVLRGVCQRG